MYSSRAAKMCAMCDVNSQTENGNCGSASNTLLSDKLLDQCEWLVESNQGKTHHVTELTELASLNTTISVDTVSVVESSQTGMLETFSNPRVASNVDSSENINNVDVEVMNICAGTSGLQKNNRNMEVEEVSETPETHVSKWINVSLCNNSLFPSFEITETDSSYCSQQEVQRNNTTDEELLLATDDIELHSPTLLDISLPICDNFDLLDTRDPKEGKNVLNNADEHDSQEVGNNEDDIGRPSCLIENLEGSADSTEISQMEDLSSNVAVTNEIGDTQQVVTHGECSRYQEENAINELGRMVNKRRKHAEPNEWFDKKNQNLREQGKSYVGWSREGKKRKRGATRSEREMGPPCSSVMCKNSKVRQCTKLLHEDRQKLFQSFWEDMNWDQKKIYIVSLIKKTSTKRCTKPSSEESRRAATLTYTIKTVDGNIVTVCKKTFLSTFGLKEWTVMNWVLNSESNGICPSRSVIAGKKNSSNPTSSKRSETAKDILCTFIDNIPKLPSHYCRRSTTKQYIEPIYGDNVSGLYREYSKQCEERTPPVKPMSRFTFENVFHEKNIGLQIPKKDRCDTCIAYETKHIDEITYRNHIESKEAARTEKIADKELGQKGECIVLTQDLQAVKVCPSLNASALYYKTKLCVHNFTIFDVNSHNTRCYWFSETDADLTANTFTSCIIDYLTDKCDLGKPIIVWSDGCVYQNKNSILSNALLSFSMSKKVMVYQKYLEVGHTQMEADSVHSLIERKIKNKAIHLPSDYARLTREARKLPPYEVKELSYSFVRNYALKSMTKYDSIRPGRKTNDPTVNDIKVIKYSPDGTIQVKLNFSDEYMDLPHRTSRNEVGYLCDFPQLRKEPIKIKYQKWQHLQELKKVIPVDCGQFYDSLPHEVKPTSKDNK